MPRRKETYCWIKGCKEYAYYSTSIYANPKKLCKRHYIQFSELKKEIISGMINALNRMKTLTETSEEKVKEDYKQ